jgi:hypothetical protein
MRPRLCAWFVSGLVLAVSTGIAAAEGFSGPKVAAGAGTAFAAAGGSGGGFSSRGFRGKHSWGRTSRWGRHGFGHGRFRHTRFPVLLGNGWGYPWGNPWGYGSMPSIQVQQINAPAAAPVYGIPSVAALPAVAGIRDARPAQPAVYVINEGPGGGRFDSRTTGSISGTARPSGPKIIELPAEGEDWSAVSEPSGGARIIHLTVPVGPRP